MDKSLRFWLFIVFTISLITLCLGLSAWQVVRLQWKTDLITQLQERATAPPESLNTYLQDSEELIAKEHRYRHFRAHGELHYSKVIYQFGRDRFGEPGLNALVPMILEDHQWLLVNIGNIETDRLEETTKILESLDHKETSLSGIAQTIHPPPWYAPDNDPGSRLWITLDTAAIASSINLDPMLGLPFTLLSDQSPLLDTLEASASWTLDVPNHHLQYALTWFFIAIGIVIMMFFWIREQRRN